MDKSDDLDAILRGILADGNERAHSTLSSADWESIEDLVQSIKTESKALFLVRHENDLMQYVLIGTDRPRAIELLGRIMTQLANELCADGDANV